MDDEVKFNLVVLGIIVIGIIIYLIYRTPVKQWEVKPYVDLVEPITKEILRVLREERILRLWVDRGRYE